MIKVIREFLGLCNHQWKTVSTIDHYWEDVEKEKSPMYTSFILRCEKCGNYKKWSAK